MAEFKTLNGYAVKDNQSINDIVNILAVQSGLKQNLSNPNLLINGDFRNPVNQRGLTSYTDATTTMYTIDRWCTENKRGIVNVNSGFVTFKNQVNDDNQGYIKQILENCYVNDYVTLSLDARTVTGTNVAVINYLDVDGVETNESYTFTHTGVSSYTTKKKASKVNKVIFYIYKNSLIAINWVKLEQGSIVTPFVPRPYAEELALCQRYYRNIRAAWLNLVNCIASSTTNLKYKLPFEMRTLPTVTASTMNWVIGDLPTNKSVTVSSFAVVQYFLDITINSSHGLTKGQCCTLSVSSGQDSAGLEFDAEIYS